MKVITFKPSPALTPKSDLSSCYLLKESFLDQEENNQRCFDPWIIKSSMETDSPDSKG